MNCIGLSQFQYWKVKIRAIVKRLYFQKVFKKLKINYLNKEDREKKIVVSLTSYPGRIKSIHLTIYSLLTQYRAPDQVVLWLAGEQFRFKEKSLPKKLLALQKYGLTIRWCKNIKSFKKLIPSLTEYPDALIVTADDDVYYDEKWLEYLYVTHKKYPKCIVCHRAVKIDFDEKGKMLPYIEWKSIGGDTDPSYSHFFTGAGGVLYPPMSCDAIVTNEKLFTKLTPTGDDIWFWATAIKNNIKIKVAEKCFSELVDIFPERVLKKRKDLTLYEINCLGKKNDTMMKNVIEYFNLENKLKL